ncbi:MAG: hypothetical protein U0230_10070 [Polyangiales bacterium]
MRFDKIEVSPRTTTNVKRTEEAVNWVVRRSDELLGKIGLGGRKANYDDVNYEFVGGPGEVMRKKHYDKSLRLLWKAQDHAPFLDFHDCTQVEKELHDMAFRAMNDDEKAAVQRLSTKEYKELLNREYTVREKQAIVSVLSAIGHGEAYAWLVSAELLAQVKSTGARAALTMQVLEEAKHFLVLRELLHAFDVPIPRLTGFEYVLLERVYKAEGLEKLFGMNVLVEGIALGLFGMMSHLPGLEILRLFHLDESRHTGLPNNYFREFPLTESERKNPVRQMKRLAMVLPAVGLIPSMEDDLAELGIDVFDFGGSVIRKIAHLADRNGFELPVSNDKLLAMLDDLMNAYCKVARPHHVERKFTQQETTKGVRELQVEHEIFLGKRASAAAQSIQA